MLVLVGFAIVSLVALAGMAADVGHLYVARRGIQTACDAAAVAAANQYSNGTATQAAQEVAALNGFVNGQNGATVSVTQPNAPNGDPSGVYFQVAITQATPTYFLRVLGYNSLNVSASAIAGNVDGPSALLALNGASSGLTVNSGASVTVGGGSSSSQGGCGVISNASLTNHGSISAPSIGVVGSCSGTTPANLHTNVPPVSNPFASLSAPTGNSCTRATGTTGKTITCNSTQTVTPAVYTNSSNYCGYIVASPSSKGSYTAISVTFNGGTYGDHISIGGTNSSGNSTGTVQNATVTFNPGTFQCYQSSSRWGGSTVTPSVEIGSSCSGSTITFNPGNYTFLGNVSIQNNNTVTLSPGTYYGGITIQDGPNGSPNVTLQPGTYYIGGGGLSVSGGCTLSGSGVTIYNTSDSSSLASTAGPINICASSSSGKTPQCSLSAPTSGSLMGILFFQNSSIGTSGSGSGWYNNGSNTAAGRCSVQGASGSTFNGAIYTPGASLTYCGSSSSSGYTIVAADAVTLASGSSIQVSCNYSSLANGLSPIKTAALYR